MVFRDIPKIGSFRLPTHRRDAHRKFFLLIPYWIKIKILPLRRIYAALGSKGLIGVKFFFVDFREIKSKISFYCLLTHRRGSHMIFLMIPSYFIFYLPNSRTTVSQEVQAWFPVQLAFAKFLSKIKGNFWGSAVSMIPALY